MPVIPATQEAEVGESRSVSPQSGPTRARELDFTLLPHQPAEGLLKHYLSALVGKAALVAQGQFSKEL
jgi:hypothetical protein